MKINLAKSAGFCFGVRRAIEIAQSAARSKQRVEMLGDIVHNEDVVKQMTHAGIRKVKNLSRGKNKTILIRAHGTPLKTLSKARHMGYKIVDATCPMVKEIHKIAVNMEKKYRSIIIIGDKRHDEVQGIIGHLKNKPLVINSPESIKEAGIKRIKKACVVVQSTQNTEKVKQIVNILTRYIKDLRFFNTICNTTKRKQNEIRSMPLDNDVMIIIGSKKSANTKRLYEISKSINRRSYWIQSEKDLKPGWFKGARTAGVTSGASTPDSITDQVIAYIKRLTEKN